MSSARRLACDREGSTVVSFWTIQPRSVWEQMERGEAVRVDPGHPKYGGEKPWQYEWLAAGLRHNSSGFDGGWPWWLRCDEPDLTRLRKAALPGGREQACIELRLPEERCLTFPLWVWETIYTGHYLALDREEFDGWYRRLRSAVPRPEDRPLPEPWRSQLEASWQRMFSSPCDPRLWYRDQALPDESAGHYTLMKEASEEVVGLTQELLSGDAVDVELFTAAGCE